MIGSDCCCSLLTASDCVWWQVSGEHGFTMLLEGALPVSRLTSSRSAHPKVPMTRKTTAKANALHVSTETANVANSDHMLLYLNRQTWTRPVESAQLSAELMDAMDRGVHVLLVHEMPGEGGQAARFGCEFGSFFACADGATPEELLKRGIYSEVAVPLKGGAWRAASLMLLGMALGMSKEEIEDAKEGGNVLGLGESSKRMARVLKRLVITRKSGARQRATSDDAERAAAASPPTAPAAASAPIAAAPAAPIGRLQKYNAMFKDISPTLVGAPSALARSLSPRSLSRKMKSQMSLSEKGKSGALEGRMAAPDAAGAGARRNTTTRWTTQWRSSRPAATTAVSVSVASATALNEISMTHDVSHSVSVTSASASEGPEAP